MTFRLTFRNRQFGIGEVYYQPDGIGKFDFGVGQWDITFNEHTNPVCLLHDSN